MDEPVFDPSKLKKQIKKKKEEQDEKPIVATVKSEKISEIPEVYSYDFMVTQLFMQKEGLHKNKEKIPFPLVDVSKDMVPTSTIKNYGEICKAMNREQSHVMLYVKLELQPKKLSINAKNELLIRGKYNTQQVKTVLSNYTNEYVKCKTCGDLDTAFSTTQGILNVECKKCQGKRAVPKLKDKV